jgi:hypothetical protein
MFANDYKFYNGATSQAIASKNALDFRLGTQIEQWAGVMTDREGGEAHPTNLTRQNLRKHFGTALFHSITESTIHGGINEVTQTSYLVLAYLLRRRMLGIYGFQRLR